MSGGFIFQISDELIQYADENDLPLFELPEKYPLIDLSQILCNKLVLEENNKNLEEQLLFQFWIQNI